MHDSGSLTLGISIGLGILIILTIISVLVVACTTGGRIKAKVTSEFEV